MSQTTVHVINHTHWDREWFLTSIYTSRWIPGLIDKIERIIANNSNYHFFLDGQTLVIEDLLKIAPEYEQKITSLIANGNLTIGPYYCQPDWRLTSGEALLRNILLGCQDTVRFGGENSTGWLVDTFGHISQSPQIHRLGGIESVYVWRGVPILEPYFHWQGTNGEELFAINLFGGYRNLYGVTHVPEIGVQRLLDEAAKLEPFYPSPDIPLFDGYDLEDNPEDPFRFYKEHLEEITPRITLVESSPQDFARQISQKMKDLPTYQGELNSGKYAATFPGTLSTRIYLKVMSEDCERLLYQVCEPLGVLARLQGRAYEQKQYESWSRALLQNAVHDCICGVSIDQVHEKMEFTSRQIFDAIQDDIQVSLAHILQDFAPGTYAISTNPIPYDGWQVIRNQLYSVQTDGIGVWRVEDSIPVDDSHELIESFTWHNDYYSAQLMEDGTLQVENSIMGALAIYREKGDAYSDERGELIEISRPQKPYLIEQKSDHHCVVKLTYSANWDDARLNAIIRLTFDRSPHDPLAGRF